MAYYVQALLHPSKLTVHRPGMEVPMLSFHRTQQWTSEQRYSILRNNFKRASLGKRLYSYIWFCPSFFDGVTFPENTDIWHPLSPQTTLTSVCLIQVTFSRLYCPIYIPHSALALWSTTFYYIPVSGLWDGYNSVNKLLSSLNKRQSTTTKYIC